MPAGRNFALGLLHAGRMGFGIMQSTVIAGLVQQAAARYGVDPALALAVAQRESGLNPNAQSAAGAQGVMQLEPPTAAQYGVTNPFDPAQNIDGGVHYLSDLLRQYGDVAKALAAYNWGPGNLNAAIARYGANWLSAVPSETQNYVAAISGVTAESNAPAPTLSPQGVPPPQTPPTLTIDMATGLPVVDSTNVDTLQPINAGFVPANIPEPLLYGGIALGMIVLARIFTKD
jgi:transglycosylase-like protein with SLT domain